jgi:hypothetical protein
VFIPTFGAQPVGIRAAKLGAACMAHAWSVDFDTERFSRVPILSSHRLGRARDAGCAKAPMSIQEDNGKLTPIREVQDQLLQLRHRQVAQNMFLRLKIAGQIVGLGSTLAAWRVEFVTNRMFVPLLVLHQSVLTRQCAPLSRPG